MAVLDVCSVIQSFTLCLLLDLDFDILLEVSVCHQLFLQLIDCADDSIVVRHQCCSVLLRHVWCAKDILHVFTKVLLDGCSKLLQ